jgi:EF hand
MRSIELWRASALMAALVLAGAAVAQPPEPKDGPPRVFSKPGRLGVEDIAERILSFDKNKDGKVAKDELPERMQDLIAKGDTNKDGTLDKDEIRKLAASPGGFGPRGEFGIRVKGPGPGPGTPGGFGPRGKFAIRIDGPGPGPVGIGGGVLEGVVDDLKLAGKKKDQAQAAVKAHQEHVRKLMDRARAELLQKMKEILSEEELKDFQAALDRPRGGATIIDVAPPGAPRPGEVERKLDQRQKDPGDLKGEIRR